MDHLWAVVGTGVRPQAETDHVVLHLFGDDEGLEAAREMDRMIAELPGLQGLTVMEDARVAAFRCRREAGRLADVRLLPASLRAERPSAMPFAALRQ